MDVLSSRRAMLHFKRHEDSRMGRFRSGLVTRTESAPGAGYHVLAAREVTGEAMGLVVGVIVGVGAFGLICLLYYFHRRNAKRQAREDERMNMDFGLGEEATGGKARAGSPGMGEQKEHNRQMSFDVNLASPYILPPQLHNSRESIHSLPRNLHEDPYRVVKEYGGSDAGSIMSTSKPREGSICTASSERDSVRVRSAASGAQVASSRHYSGSSPKSPLSVPPSLAPHTSWMSEEPLPPLPALKGLFETAEESPTAPSPLHLETLPAIREPAAAVLKTPDKNKQSPCPLQSPTDSAVDVYEKPLAGDVQLTPGSDVDLASFALGLHNPADRQPAPGLVYQARPEEPLGLGDLGHPQMPATGQVKQPSTSPMGQDDFEPRGRDRTRQPQVGEKQLGSSIGVAHHNTQRLSTGLRPLPPDEIMESEDPEFRANRIRSFYKEYFEDHNKGPAIWMPPVPGQHSARRQPGHFHSHMQTHSTHQVGEYYEDYDANYLGDVAYFDADSSTSVMPYAHPVGRRAMTPPPSRRRAPSSGGPLRGNHGSMGAMSMHRGPPLRSAPSSHSCFGPRHGASTSASWGRPRAVTAGSTSRKKHLPAPAALNTLPTPSKLKDDSFALLNAMDFAPPETYGSRARGRSQSPMGERRPYKVTVPVHSPLVNPLEELPAIPSPHLLSKSSTFTGLGFAPPRKFAESDSRSETGSIRSNRSGISAANLNAIRSGAGRVSRLPGDTIFTQAALQNTLKPSWNMREQV